MNDTLLFGLNSLKGVKQFGEDHALTPAALMRSCHSSHPSGGAGTVCPELSRVPVLTGVSNSITLIEALDACIHQCKRKSGTRRILVSTLANPVRVKP